jgi:hypothetical protein
MTRKLTQAEKVQRELDRWYARNPDDAREHDADDIAQRLQVPLTVAQAMYSTGFSATRTATSNRLARVAWSFARRAPRMTCRARTQTLGVPERVATCRALVGGLARRQRTERGPGGAARSGVA